MYIYIHQFTDVLNLIVKKTSSPWFNIYHIPEKHRPCLSSNLKHIAKCLSWCVVPFAVEPRPDTTKKLGRKEHFLKQIKVGETAQIPQHHAEEWDDWRWTLPRAGEFHDIFRDSWAWPSRVATPRPLRLGPPKVETAFEEENLERAEELPQESQSWVIMADAQRIAQVVEDLLSARISVQSWLFVPSSSSNWSVRSSSCWWNFTSLSLAFWFW